MNLRFFYCILRLHFIINVKHSTKANNINQDGRIEIDERREGILNVLSNFCTRHEVRNGSWKNITLSKAPYNPFESSYNWKKNYAPICGVPSDYNKPEWKSYDWKPDKNKDGKCRFDKWDSKKFCKVAKVLTRGEKFSTSIVIAGDSLSWEHYTSLSFSLGIDVDNEGQYYSRNKGKMYELNACDGEVQMSYRRSDQLEYIPEILEIADPSVLIINKGAHVKPASEFKQSLELTIASLEKWQLNCKKRRKTCWVIVRTTVPGHPNCKKGFYEPVNDIKEMEDYITDLNNYDEISINYGWFKFKKYNEMMLDMFEKSMVEFDVIDAYEINIRRPDLHYDCLHSCIPGKQEVYNQILMNLMEMKVLKKRLGKDLVDRLVEKS